MAAALIIRSQNLPSMGLRVMSLFRHRHSADMALTSTLASNPNIKIMKQNISSFTRPDRIAVVKRFRVVQAPLYLLLLSLGVYLAGCQKGNLLSNPNAATSSTSVPPTLILNRITNEIYKGGGVLD